jgi:hypothetical protein
MESVAPGEAQLTAEIEALRARFPVPKTCTARFAYSYSFAMA